MRYLLFAYDTYYPCGGWNDFEGSYDTLDEAEEAARTLRRDHWHIIDMATLREVSSS